MRVIRVLVAAAFPMIMVLLSPVASLLKAAEGPQLIFAVVTKDPKDRSQVTAQILVKDRVAEGLLLPTEATMQNPMWKKLELCQGVKAEAIFTPAGYQILNFRIVGGRMLPMPLQGAVGDCFERKALDFAPLVE